MSSIWQQCLQRLQNEVQDQQFNTWIRPLRAQASADDASLIELIAPNRFVRDWVNDRFLARIHALMIECSGNQRLPCPIVLDQRDSTCSTPVFQGLQESAGVSNVSISTSVSPKVSTPVSVPTVQPSTPSSLAGASSTQTSDVNTQDHSSNAPSAFTNVPAKPITSDLSFNKKPVSTVTPIDVKTKPSSLASLSKKYENTLQPNYTFDTYVEGKSNQFARAAAMQVAANPGDSYNPMFIYGGVGLGKTHLMHAIGHELLLANPDAKVVYLHSERFVADMVKALQLNAINDFKRYYRSVDALLIDDIQFFAGKDRSQEEFFHTFNALLEHSKQVILTCDRFPKEINGLEERLRSRFGWGLTIQIDPPELETRVAILKKKAEQLHVDLPDETAFFIAKLLKSNVRELEGALNRVIANGNFLGQPLIISVAKTALRDVISLQDRMVTIGNIQKTVCDFYKIKLNDLLSKRRNRSLARPRQIAMSLAKELTNKSLPDIGNEFGGRDHTTVLHACKRIKELRATSSEIEQDYKELLRKLTT